jgi:hypothetical protein
MSMVLRRREEDVRSVTLCVRQTEGDERQCQSSVDWEGSLSIEL